MDPLGALVEDEVDRQLVIRTDHLPPLDLATLLLLTLLVCHVDDRVYRG